jgi:hypothetical protein
MSDDRTVKKIFLGETRRKRKRRKTKIMWLEFIASDLKCMGVKRWRNTAEDRTASAVILKVALVKLGHVAATSQKVAGSITDGVIGIFLRLIPLGSTRL